MRRVLACAVAVALTCAPAAVAHEGNPRMLSVVRSVTPRASGLSLQVLNRDDRFELINRTGRTVLVFGYSAEPYARLLADGTVQVNRSSPAYYLNQDRYAAGIKVPDGLGPRTAPSWRTIDRTGRFEWHDHRMHYMAPGVPSQVKDQSKRQVFAHYRIPLRVGDRRVQVRGDQVWTPLPGGGPPVAAVVVLTTMVVAGVGAIVVVRRRRGISSDADSPASEVW